MMVSAGIAARCLELRDNVANQVWRRRLRHAFRVFNTHRLPFEGAKLVEGLYFDPLNVLHRGDKPRYSFNVLWRVGEPRDEGKANPNGLCDRRESLGKTHGWREIASGH